MNHINAVEPQKRSKNSHYRFYKSSLIEDKVDLKNDLFMRESSYILKKLASGSSFD